MSECLSHINEDQLASPCKTSVTSCLARSENGLLLIDNGSDQLTLFDHSTGAPSKVRDIVWCSETNGLIRDICWAGHINAFLILGDDALCSYSPSSDEFIIHLKPPSSIENFWSFAVLGCDTFVLYRHDTLQRYCLPLWLPTRSWTRSMLIDINNSDQFIGQIRAHSSMGTIALLIRLKRHHQWRIDLFDRTMQRLYSGESVRMTTSYPRLIFTPLNQHGQWTLVGQDNIWLINAYGCIIDCHARTLENPFDKVSDLTFSFVDSSSNSSCQIDQ